jgi:hypothetical protein
MPDFWKSQRKLDFETERPLHETSYPPYCSTCPPRPQWASRIKPDDDWTRSYLPLKAGKDLDGEELSRKLTASLKEGKRQIREELKKRNGPWVESLNTALTRYFFAWNLGRVSEELFDTYTEAGGEASEADLMEKVAFFNTIYDTPGEENLTKPDGGKWQSEDEMWECWVGSEKEAKRVCRTMDEVFRPMVQ